ncbi:MAG: nucleoside phosphorylase [Desulforhopalus sp.]|jgi:nucleoside phosphorylase
MDKIVIITNNYNEYEQFIDLLSQRLIKSQDFKLNKSQSGKKYISNDLEIYIVPLETIGITQTALTTSNIIKEIKPKYLILAGVGTGLNSKNIRPGDLIVATQILDFSNRKVLNSETLYESKTYKTSSNLIKKARNIKKTDWISAGNRNLENSKPTNIHFGPIASSDRLLNSSNQINNLTKSNRNILGVERESAGLLAALENSKSNIEFIEILSIVDSSNEKNNQSIQYSSYLVVLFTLELIFKQISPQIKESTKNSTNNSEQPSTVQNSIFQSSEFTDEQKKSLKNNDRIFKYETSETDQSVISEHYSSTNQKYMENENRSIKGTYLLAYDPERFEFSKTHTTASQIMKNGKAMASWSCGKKMLPANARIFLVRHGKDTPGIIASGLSVKESHSGPHWDPQKAANGQTTNFIDVEWDTFKKIPLLALDELIEKTGEKELWARRSNGMEIPKPINSRLEIAWQKARVGIPTDIPEPYPFGYNDSPPSSTKESRRGLKATERDRLNIKHQAKSFATLLISKSAKGPFAIALLGAWGVGKTHFMRIMQETIELVAGKESFREDNSDTVSRVAQIEFNAWHYVDTNLWACLASHIFDELAKELQPLTGKPENTRLKLRKKIHSSGQEIKKAKAAAVLAKNERSEAIKKLEEVKNNRGKQIQAVWEALTDAPKTDEAKKMVEMKNSTNKVVEKLGLTEPLKTAKDVEKIYKSFKEIKNRGRALAGFIDTAFTGKNTFTSIFFLCALLFLVFAFPWLISKLDPTLVESGILSPAIQVATFLCPIIVWASKNINSISKAMGHLESIQEVLQSPPQSLKKFKEEISKCDAAILFEKERIRKAEQEISRAQSEIQRINSGGLVYDFLERKKADSRYIDRMGLISVIRKDFEELKKVLKEWNQNEEGVTPIERVVLYIDDLDRCPTNRVVEVLQAVHLLLAFDLFNVVVAVDARWLERSLNEAYNPSETIKNSGLVADRSYRFSAHNYLEKIFQIPFSLPLMGKTGYRSLVESLVNPPDINFGLIPPPSSVNDVSLSGQKMAQKESDNDISDIKKDEQVLSTSSQNAQTDTVKIEPVEIERYKEQEANIDRLKTMELHSHEKIFIASLYEFIPTPRLANRFINIYRLLRVRANLLNDDMTIFLNRETGEYRAVLLLLAINVGHPKYASAIFNNLNSSEKNFFEWLTLIQQNGSDLIQGDDENKSSEFDNEFKQIPNKINLVLSSLLELSGPGIDNDMENYKKWANEVGYYSFHWHLKIEGREQFGE